MGIITLLFINSTISFIEENNAGNAAAALMARLAPKAKVSGFKKAVFHCTYGELSLKWCVRFLYSCSANLDENQIQNCKVIDCLKC